MLYARAPCPLDDLANNADTVDIPVQFELRSICPKRKPVLKSMLPRLRDVRGGCAADVATTKTIPALRFRGYATNEFGFLQSTISLFHESPRGGAKSLAKKYRAKQVRYAALLC